MVTTVDSNGDNRRPGVRGSATDYTIFESSMLVKLIGFRFVNLKLPLPPELVRSAPVAPDKVTIKVSKPLPPLTSNVALSPGVTLNWFAPEPLYPIANSCR